MTTTISTLVLSAILVAVPATAWCTDGSAGFPMTVRDSTGGVTCLPGFHCGNLDPANQTTWPVACPVDTQCSIDRIFGITCDDRVEPFEPKICPKGKYCPNPTQVLQCPSNKFCTYGTVDPKSCPMMSLCPEGTEKPRFYGGFLLMIICIVVFVVVFLLYHRSWRYRGQDHTVADVASSSSMTTPGENNNNSENDKEKTNADDKLKSGYHPHGVNNNDHHHRHRDHTTTHPDHEDHEMDVHSNEPIDESANGNELDDAIARLDNGFQRARGNRKPMRIDADELRVVLPDGKVLLHGVSGSLRPGKVTAIMGPSGAGKTVFMTTVLGRIDPAWKVEGGLSVNGQQIRLGGIRSQIGFVPQDDVLHTELTVDANLFYSSEMRSPRDWSVDDRRAMREAVLDALHLESLRCTTVGDARVRGISASQRKRVSAGVEMASAPLVLFLDEPTSGLDSTTSLDLVRVLKKTATFSELTVAMVVHQPRVEIWNELDEVLLLAPGGRTVYLGPQRNVVEYFTKCGTIFGLQDNPADVVMDTIAARGEEFVEFWKQHLATTNDTTLTPLAPTTPMAEGRDVTVAPEKATVGYQILLFHLRAIEKQLSLMKGLGIEAGVLAIIAVLVGYAMTDYVHTAVYIAPYNRISPINDMTVLPQLHMFIVISIGMAAGVAGVAVFGREREQYFRDSQAGLSKVGYFVGTATSSIYRIILASLVFVGIILVLSSMIPPFPIVFTGVFLMYWVCYGVAACVSVTTPASIAPLLASMICNVLSLANGFVDFPTFIKKASPTFHFSQFMQQYHVDAIKHWGSNAWGKAGYVDGQVASSMAIVLLWAVILHIAAFGLMVFTHKAQQR